jgi:hypothetical protein
MQRIMVITDSNVAAGAFWRTTGWISQLCRQYPGEFEYTFIPPEAAAAGRISWDDFDSYDYFFFHRPVMDYHVGVMRTAQKFGKSVIVDFDDWLWDVPLDNMTFATYQYHNIRNNMTAMLREANIITTSTQQLKLLLEQAGNRTDILVCPNAVPKRWTNLRDNRPPKKEDERLTFLWRGSQHHQKDLVHMRPAFVELSKVYPNAKWKFVGYLPWFMFDEIPGVLDGKINTPDWENRPPTEINGYFDNLVASEPDVVLTPLFDSMFNRAKSNIAWMEGLLGGANCVAPNWPEWNKPGVFNYKANDTESFVDAVEAAIQQKGKTDFAWAFMKKHLSIENVNEIRYHFLKKNMSHATSKSTELVKVLNGDHNKVEVVNDHSWNESVR